MRRFVWLLLGAVVVAAPRNAIAHAGRRFEVVVIQQQLAGHGYNSGPNDGGGSPRAYLNALHGEWSNAFGSIALADLPGFDVFDANTSVVGAGAALALAGQDLSLTLVSSARWENPSLHDPYDAPLLTSYRTDGPIADEELTVGGDTSFVDQIGGTLSLAQSIPSTGEEDIDLDYSIASMPDNVLHVLQWRLSTTANGIATSDSLFTIFMPDSSENRDLTQEALLLERHLAQPLIGGDLNRNGVVDAGDYLMWRKQYGFRPLYPGSGADANADGVVDAADYTHWRNRLHSPGQSPRASNSTNAPEPAGLAVALTALTSAWLARQRK